MNFTWDTFKVLKQLLKRLREAFVSFGDTYGGVDQDYIQKFRNFVNDDLDTPKALALAWDLLKDDKVNGGSKKATLLEFDKIFGLNLKDAVVTAIPKNIKDLAEEREIARKDRNWDKADLLRNEINKAGFEINDEENGFSLKAK